MSRPPTGADLVRAALASPPRRAALAHVIQSPPQHLPHPPAQPIARWVALGDATGIATLMEQAGPAKLERMAYARAPDSFMATQGAPLAVDVAFEERHEAEAVLRTLGARGWSAARISGALKALMAAWPLFERRPPQCWSSSEVMGVCAHLLDIGAGAEAAGRLCQGTWALWTALGRDDRISGAVAVLSALQED